MSPCSSRNRVAQPLEHLSRSLMKYTPNARAHSPNPIACTPRRMRRQPMISEWVYSSRPKIGT